MPLPTIQDLEDQRDEAAKAIDPASASWRAFLRYVEAQVWLLSLASAKAEDLRSEHLRSKIKTLEELKDLAQKRNTVKVSEDDPS